MTSFYDRPRKFHPGQHSKFTPLLKKERSERTFNRICEDHLTCDRKCSKIYPSGTLFYAICTPAILGIPYASATLKTPKIHIRACICIYKKSHNLICNMGP